MTLAQLIAQVRAQINTATAARNGLAAERRELLVAETPNAERSAELAGLIVQADADIDALRAKVAEYEQILAEDNAADELARQEVVTPEAVQRENAAQERTQRVEVKEPRTYARETDPTGKRFLDDIVQQYARNDLSASERLKRHMAEERVERGQETFERAASGSGAYTGLVVPQYLVDEFADFVRAGRPLADTLRTLPLPETGMTINVGKATTGTSVGNQANEGDAVSETNFDDTLLTIPIRTASGSQTVTRQAIDRGIGVDSVTIGDLFAAYATDLDYTLINDPVHGLTANGVATAITYTDAAPSVAALYPKLLQAGGQAAAALKNKKVEPIIAVGTTLRWFWLLSQLTDKHPAFPTANLPVGASGVDYAAKYGSGFAGLLPSGMAYIQDDNVPANLGAGNNQDELYFVDPGNALLWEDPNAPMLIRAEQPSAKKLGVDLVVYGYFGFEFQRRQHAQKIGGTGLVAPAF